MNKEKKLKVSVIIPCYNQGKYLKEAVSSVLKQTYQNFEIIIINDGSTDQYTNDLLRDYKETKVRVFHTENNGLANARNFGFRKSAGDLIQFLDADDYLNKKKFEEQIKIFKSDKTVDICYTDYQYYYENDKKFVKSSINLKLGHNPFEDFLYKWQRGLSIPIHCALFKRDVFRKELPFIRSFRAIEDWIMWVNLAQKNCNFRYINKNYATYRIQKENMTKDKYFMLYWVTRAISYIAENFIEEKDLEKYNIKQKDYIKHLIRIYFLEELNTKFLEDKKIVNEREKEIKRILGSKTYKAGELIMWIPKRIKQRFINHKG